MSKTPYALIELALDSLALASTYIPHSLEEYMTNIEKQDAVTMRLQIAGESLASVRSAFPEFYKHIETPEVRNMIAIRNVISHNYLGVDQEIVYDVVSTKISILEEQLHIILASR